MIDLNHLPAGSAVDALYRSTDGPVSDRLLSAARAIDTAWRKENPPPKIARVRIGRITMHKAVAIDMMAREISERALEGCVREVDLIKLGFTTKQIADWAPDAYRKALATNPDLADCLNVAA